MNQPELKFDMPCPKGCGFRWDILASVAAPGITHTCLRCGASFQFTDDQAQKIAEAVSGLRRAIGGFLKG